MNKTLAIAIILLVALGILVMIPGGTKPEDTTEVSTPNENQNTDSGQVVQEKFEGTVTAYDTGCFVDAICSVTVGDRTVILVTGSRMLGEEPVGSLMGVPSIGDLEKKIGSKAEVFARKLPSGEYTLYGNTEYYVRIK